MYKQNLRNPEAHEKSLWDWGHYNDVLPYPMKAMGDIDACAAHRSETLFIETKKPGEDMTYGQECTYGRLLARGRTTILIVEGDVDEIPQRVKVGTTLGLTHEEAWETDVPTFWSDWTKVDGRDGLRTLISTWATLADKQPSTLGQVPKKFRPFS